MKNLLLILSMFTGLIPVFSQYSPEHTADSLKLDSLKKLLPSLRDSAHVDCLNAIAETYSELEGLAFLQRIDSMYRYGSIANGEASKIGYKYGVALSLLNMGKALQNGRQNKASTDFVRRALALSEELHDYKLLGKSYYLLANLENTIENYKKAISYFQESGDIQDETEVTTWLCMKHSDKGDYEEAFPYCKKCLELAKKNVEASKSSWAYELVQWSLFDMSALYKNAGDYETAMNYLLRSNKYAEENHLAWKMLMDISEMNCLMGKYDSALYYWNLWKKDWNLYADGHRALGNTMLAQIYLKTGQPEKALPLVSRTVSVFDSLKKTGWISNDAFVRPLLFAGTAHLQMKNYPLALKLAKSATLLAEETQARPYMIDCFDLLSKVYHVLGNNDSAYVYLLKYIAIKDSIQNKQFLLRLDNYKRTTEDEKKQAQLLLLNKDNKIKAAQLKQQSLVRNFLIVGLLVLIITALFVYRTITLKRNTEKLKREQLENQLNVHQLESEKRQAELQQKAMELEMQALRAQMNPHFIFNCLSSINRFILKNESKSASNYLTRFSRLIRMVLINSQKSLITLEEELQMLRLYLDMERLRFKESFDYSITFLNTMETDNIFIPPLLLQPFCENAIWHGLMQKDGKGRLEIELRMRNDVLECAITDNGIGRKKAGEMKSLSAEKEKSMGLRITGERLALLSEGPGEQSDFEIEDLINSNGNAEGTRVNLKVRYKDSVEAHESKIKSNHR